MLLTNGVESLAERSIMMPFTRFCSGLLDRSKDRRKKKSYNKDSRWPHLSRACGRQRLHVRTKKTLSLDEHERCLRKQLERRKKNRHINCNNEKHIPPSQPTVAKLPSRLLEHALHYFCPTTNRQSRVAHLRPRIACRWILVAMIPLECWLLS